MRIEQGQKGKQVAEVVEVDEDPVPGPSAKSQPRSFSKKPALDGPEKETTGSVKWYNAEKGFGFIGPDDGGKDIFVHVSPLTRSGIATLADGQTVSVTYVQGQKGPKARLVKTL